MNGNTYTFNTHSLEDASKNEERFSEWYEVFANTVQSVNIQGGVEQFAEVAKFLPSDVKLSFRGQAFRLENIEEMVREEKEQDLVLKLETRLRPPHAVERIDNVIEQYHEKKSLKLKSKGKEEEMVQSAGLERQ